MPISNPSAQQAILAANYSSDFPALLPGGRLSLVSTDPLGGATDATLLFYVPYLHSFVPVWDNAANVWVNAKIPNAGISISSLPLPGGTADILAFGEGGSTAQVAAQGWASDTGRLFPLTFNGLRCIDYGAEASPRYRTYLGTIRTTGSGSASRLQDTNQFRHVWNNYNQIAKPTFILESANSWLNSSSTGRNLNNNANNRLELLAGITGYPIEIEGRFSATVPGATSAIFALSFNGVFDGSTQVVLPGATAGEASVDNKILKTSALGMNTIRAVEFILGGGNTTIYGYGRNGLRGFWLC